MLMHTRVMGQFSILAILVSTMGFYDYMRSRGPFLEPWEIEARLARQKEEQHDALLHDQHKKERAAHKQDH